MKVNKKVGSAPKKQTPEKDPKEEVVFGWGNYKWMLIGVLVLILGFVLMAGGGSDNPEVFNGEEMFSWRRIGLAPIVVVAGFVIVGYSIMRKKK